MQRVTVQLSTIVVALAFGMVTFAQEPAPSAPLAAPMYSAPSAPAPAAASATGTEMKGSGEKHQGACDRKAEKQRRKAWPDGREATAESGEQGGEGLASRITRVASVWQLTNRVYQGRPRIHRDRP